MLCNLGFAPSKADSDVWMRACPDYYEYICVYVDDLAIAMREPQVFIDALVNTYGYKLKGVGPMSYHLGADIYRDSDGTLCFGAKSYIGQMMINYKTMFGEKPKEYNSPMDKNDHPELDMTAELVPKEDIKKYQSLIGALQWVISLCRFDIHCAVMTMHQKVGFGKGKNKMVQFWSSITLFCYTSSLFRIKTSPFLSIQCLPCFTISKDVKILSPKFVQCQF